MIKAITSVPVVRKALTGTMLVASLLGGAASCSKPATNNSGSNVTYTESRKNKGIDQVSYECNKYKGNNLFIVDSLKILSEKKPKLKFKMLFVGGGQDTDVLKKHINECNLEKEVIKKDKTRKVNYKEKLKELLKEGDVVLFPNDLPDILD